MARKLLRQFERHRPFTQNHGAARAAGTRPGQYHQPHATSNENETDEQKKRKIEEQQSWIVVARSKGHSKKEDHQIKNPDGQTRDDCGKLPATLETIETPT